MAAHDLAMDIRLEAKTGSPIRGVPHKPIENPQRPKPTYASDEECAELLGPVLRQVPRALVGDERSRFPLLDALNALDRSRHTDVARELTFIAAVNHRTADERRTAEYLLRNRQEVVEGRRPARSLLMAARCAAEMDVRRVRQRECSLPHTLAVLAVGDVSARGRCAEDMVVDALRTVVGSELITAVEDRLLDAITIALEVAGRHALNRGRGSAVLAMRSDARPQSRLVTHLRRELDDDGVARNLARLLVGADGTPIETALLWWSARRKLGAVDVPVTVRDRWLRYLRACGTSRGDSASYPQPSVTTLPPAHAPL